jgi:uncharacterized cupin superfamily protein
MHDVVVHRLELGKNFDGFGEASWTEDDKEPRRFAVGDTFILRPGFTGTWRTIETVRKLWVIVSP